jgi:hypothetical protein
MAVLPQGRDVAHKGQPATAGESVDPEDLVGYVPEGLGIPTVVDLERHSLNIRIETFTYHVPFTGGG